MGIKRRLNLLLFTILWVFIIGSIGYYIIYGGKQNFLDCIFMTVISLTTVGYGEVLPVSGNPTAQIFTMILVTFGMGVILYAIGTLTALLIEGELTDILRKNKMEKAIQKLSGHYILCGGGETGGPLLKELVKNRETAVLIESEKHRIDLCLEIIPELLYIQGDATDDQNLIKANIHNASGIIISLPSDKDNLYITMTARMMNQKIRIISRMTDQRIEPKLRKAGADGVVSPNFIGALRMASEMIRPAAVDFLDRMLRHDEGNLRIHELNISKASLIVGKTILESDLKNKFNLLVLGAKNIKGEISFNPPATWVLQPGTTLIVMGDVMDIKLARQNC